MRKSDEFRWALLLFLLAFGIRAFLWRNEYIFGHDSYWHIRVIMHLKEKPLDLPFCDPLAYYYAPCELRMDWLPFIAGYFPLFSHWFIFGDEKDLDSFLWIAKLLPPLFGALAVIFVYLFLRESTNRDIALLGAFLAAVISGFVYRTMAGFYEDDATGFLWMAGSLYFLARGIRRRCWKDTIFSGIFAFFMGISWKFYPMLPITLLGIAAVFFFLGAWEELKHTLVAVLIFSVLIFPIEGLYWEFQLLRALKIYFPLPQNVPFLLEGPQVGIGEESPGRLFWLHKFNLFALFPLPIPFLQIPFLGAYLALYLSFRKKQTLYVLPAVWTLFGGFLGFVKLKFTYCMGIPVALGSAVALFYFLKEKNAFLDRIAQFVVIGLSIYAFLVLAQGTRAGGRIPWVAGLGLSILILASRWKELRNPKPFRYLLVLFFLVGAVAAGTVFVRNHSYDLERELQMDSQAYNFLKNLGEVRLLNAWSEGHRLTLLAGVKVWADNTNRNPKAPNGDHAYTVFNYFLLTGDANRVKRFVESFGSKEYPTHLFFRINSLFTPGFIARQAGLDPRKYWAYVCRPTILQGKEYWLCMDRETGDAFLMPRDAGLWKVWTNKPNVAPSGFGALPGRDIGVGYEFGNMAIVISPELNNSFLAKLILGGEPEFPVVFFNGDIAIVDISRAFSS